MAFKGDLSTIGLAEVFQMISMSSKEGTLVVKDTESRKCIYFGRDGVRLLSTGTRKEIKIGEMLVRSGHLPEEELVAFLGRQKHERRASAGGPPKLLGTMLVEAGLVEQDVINQVVRSQVEEEISDLFLWKNATFEFIEGPPSPELTDPEVTATRLPLDVNTLLMEALRRVDEWHVIGQKITGMESIYVFVSEASKEDALQEESERFKQLLALIDGESTVQDLVEKSGLSRFEVCQVLVRLLDRNRVRLLLPHEIVAVAAQMRGAKRLMLLRSLPNLSDDPDMSLIYASALEEEGHQGEAAGVFSRLGLTLAGQGNTDRALSLLERARELAPDDAAVGAALVELLHGSGNDEAAERMGVDFLKQWIQREDFEKVRSLGRHFIAILPQSVRFRARLVQALSRLALPEEMNEEIQLIRRSATVEAPLDPEIERILQEVAPPPSRPSSRPARPRKRRRRGLLIGLGVVTVISGIVVARYEIRVRDRYREIEDQVRALEREKRWGEALTVIQRFLEGGGSGLSFLTRAKAMDYQNLLEQKVLQERTRKTLLESEALNELERLSRSAEEKYLEGNLDVAQLAVEQLQRKAEGWKNNDYLERASDLRRRINERLAEAASLAKDAGNFEKEGDYREAVRAIQDLLQRFPFTDVARNMEFPLAVTARPEGVRVLKNGTLKGETGVHPLILHFGPREKATIEFVRRGYVGKKMDAETIRTAGEVHIVLDEKQRFGFMNVGSNVTTTPLEVGGALYVAARNELLAFSFAQGGYVFAWKETLDAGDIGASPRHNSVTKRLYFGTRGKTFYSVDPFQPAGRRIVWRFGVQEAVLAASVFSPNGETVYVASADRHLYALDARSGTERWRHEFPQPLSVDLTGDQERVYVCCGDSLYAIRSDRASAWTFKTGGTLASAPTVGEGVVYLASGDGRLYAIDAATGTERWNFPTGHSLSGTPSLVGDVVAFL